MNITMPQTKDPFQKGILGADDMDPYAVYYILYEAVKRGLTEADPTTTDWESCKARINNGQIGAMVLGSWAIVQMQAAGDHADDIGYMPFPITVKGTQYASAGADYCFGVNKNTTDDKKLAAMLYIKWFSESSNFAFDQGGVPVLADSGRMTLANLLPTVGNLAFPAWFPLLAKAAPAWFVYLLPLWLLMGGAGSALGMATLMRPAFAQLEKAGRKEEEPEEETDTEDIAQ